MAQNRLFPRLADIIVVREDRPEHACRRGLTIASPCDVLSVYLRGGPRYRLDGRTHEVRSPFALLVPRGTLDCDLQAGRIEGLFVLFRGHGLVRKIKGRHGQALVSLGGAGIGVPLWKHLARGDAEHLTGRLRALAGIELADVAGRLRGAALLLEALAEYCAAGRPGAGPAVHREAERLRVLIDARPYDNRSLESIYEGLELSPAHAEKLFKAAFHITPVAYRLQSRLGKARELLVSSKLNVGQVARSVGFGDPLYFSRLFRRTFGLAPSDLIREFSGRRPRA